MNWYYPKTPGLMGGSQAGWFLGIVLEIVVIVDLVLVAVWLWKQIEKK